jgi:AbrB family looped-hinge helix DNA binding protein
MAETKDKDVVLRPKRQVTIPRKVCERLGLKTGDILELTVENSNLVAKPRKTRSLEALREIQRTFHKSGISEEDLHETGKRVRQEIVREHDAQKY